MAFLSSSKVSVHETAMLMKVLELKREAGYGARCIFVLELKLGKLFRLDKMSLLVTMLLLETNVKYKIMFPFMIMLNSKKAYSAAPV